VAVLSDPSRAAVWAEMMSDADVGALGLTKADLRAAINAADDWADANAASFNTALPVAARTALSPRQKAMLLMFVIARRYKVA